MKGIWCFNQILCEFFFHWPVTFRRLTICFLGILPPKGHKNLFLLPNTFFILPCILALTSGLYSAIWSIFKKFWAVLMHLIQNWRILLIWFCQNNKTALNPVFFNSGTQKLAWTCIWHIQCGMNWKKSTTTLPAPTSW